MRVRRDDYWHAYTTGTQMCGLRHVCPVCTAKAAEEDRRFVNDGLAAARALPGVWPVMLTLTTRHSRRERAEEVLAGVKQAEQRVKRLKIWRRISEQSIGYVRAFEWTHGKNGHHPHFHTILLIEAKTEADAVALVQEMQPAYMRQLARAGRDGTSAAAWRHSFQVQGAAAVEGYITKWGAAEEITQGHKKEAGGEGLTSWQILRRSRTLDDDRDRQQAAAIWWEIVQATKGASQLYKSQGFIELVEAWRELEPEGEEESSPEELADLGVRKGRWATSRFEAYRVRTLAVREAAERHEDLVTARAAVERELGAGQSDEDAIDEIDAPDEIDLIDDDFAENMWIEPARKQRDASPGHTLPGMEQEVRHGSDGREDEEGEAARTLAGRGLGRASGSGRQRTSAGSEGLRGISPAAIAADRFEAARPHSPPGC